MPKRHSKLVRACRSLQNQTMAEWEHIIIPNGYDGALHQVLTEAGHLTRCRLLPLGRPHPTPGHWNRVLGGLVAEAPYIAYLDDDNAFRPRHLEVLCDALDADPSIGFAYSKAFYIDREFGDGAIKPGRTVNYIDASMIVHRAELLTRYATWDPHMASGNSYALDGMLVDLWLSCGVTFAFVPEITMDYFEIGYGLDGGGVN
jgi:hypothetical protein